MELSLSELDIIKEEEANLLRLQLGYLNTQKNSFRDNILQEIADLNEAIPEVNDDELPQIKAQLNRLDAILNQMNEYEVGDLDIKNPYFGHMRFEDSKGIKDLYVGSYVFRTSDGMVQVIDWRKSPISMIYFLYEAGDDFEEEIEGRLFEGTMLSKRIIRITDGYVSEVQTDDTILSRTSDNQWKRVESKRFLLKGGAGVATRPENTVTMSAQMGLKKDGTFRKSKMLPEITALIDPEQFDLITQPSTGVVAIQGLAGSGKTTVALHRVAWLHFQDQRKFAAKNILVMVFNKALSNYISKVLPSLGVKGVVIECFEDWVSRLRRRLFSGQIAGGYSENTPVTVIRFKKHPVLLQLMNEYIAGKTNHFDEKLKEFLRDHDSYATLMAEITDLPLISKIFILKDWVEGKRKLNNVPFEAKAEIRNRVDRLIRDFIDPTRSRMETLIDYWEELFSDFEYFSKSFRNLTDDFSENQLHEVVDWMKRQYTKLNSSEPKGKKDLMDVFSDEKSVNYKEAVLDYEDDAILVYLYQKLFKEISIKNQQKLRYDHLMVDEVQDFSPVELATLVNIAKKPLSLTFAGDVNQRMIKHSGFLSWEKTFETLNIEGQKISALKVGYRSTYEIMQFGLTVLEDLANSKEFIATRHGPPVEFFRYSSQGEMVQYLNKNLVDLMTYEPMASVALICATPEEAVLYYELLEKLDVSDLRLVDDQNFPFTPGIDVTDIRQVKGLEFDYVILLDVDAVNYKNDSYSRYLLHIGASRAAHQLWIMNYRKPSAIIPESYVKPADVES